jgi:hypothetical protein
LHDQARGFTPRGLFLVRDLHEVKQRAEMDKTDTPTQQGGLWSWVVIGLVFCAVTAALFGPFIWELAHSV